MPDPVADPNVAGNPPSGTPAPAPLPAPGSDWRSSLPDELKAEKSLETFKDIPSLAKSYVEAQKMIGGSVRIPKEDAKPEEWDAFYKKLGRPDKVEDYNIAKPAEMPEGVVWNDDLTKWFTQTAHSTGLSKGQVQKIMKSWNDMELTKTHAAQKEMGQRLSKIQEQWGDEFDGRVELGVRGIERLLPKEEAVEFKALMDTTGMGNHPLVLKYAYLVGKMLQEDGYIIGDGRGGALGVEGAKGKIAAINADTKHPYWDETNPGHKAAVEEMTKLHRTAFPG